jgi:hypothetical protein
VSDRGLGAGKLEYRSRTSETSEEFPAAQAIGFVRARLAAG